MHGLIFFSAIKTWFLIESIKEVKNMRDHELVYEIGKEVMRRLGLLTLSVLEGYLMITELIPLLIAANTVLKALLLLTILIFSLCIIVTFISAIM